MCVLIVFMIFNCVFYSCHILLYVYWGGALGEELIPSVGGMSSPHKKHFQAQNLFNDSSTYTIPNIGRSKAVNTCIGYFIICNAGICYDLF